MKLSDFNYSLPKDLIAQFPLEKRDESRLLVLDRKTKRMEHKKFIDVLDYLNSGDALILNNTKVILARLFGNRKSSGGKVEVLLLDKIDNRRFHVLIKPLRRLKMYEDIVINNNGFSFKLVDFSQRIIEFNRDDVWARLEELGHVPLPQYIRRTDVLSDRARYQTVYAKKEGAVAAPTAGLHFSESLLRKIRDKGIKIAFVTLHVGYGTFAPVKEEDISEHQMHKEYFQIPLETIELIRETRGNKGKIVSVGTTTCRALEANRDKITAQEEKIGPLKGYTDLFIYPPFKFQVADSLITNFHLPQSTLYMLVAAFAGLNKIKKAYAEAIENKYRFYSYGDAMLIL
jgi:S-adenosylmethionine:tRNA ribosyltransferase-isomerase